MKKTSVLLLLCLVCSCAKTIEVGNEKRTKNVPPSTTTGKVAAVLNQASIEHQENVIEIYQAFQAKSKENEWLSVIHPLEVNDVSFIRMSAFTLDLESKGEVQFRIYDKGQWSSWTELPESREQVNPNRRVFSGLNIFQDVEKIQFKSNGATQSPVVFRLFVALNQN
ncbi:MAG: hypothetical protein HRU41_37060 [Saprospiraceae bacterium]|nr:hypothetical protein [Saprospiraceae bacterium]